MKKRIKKKNSIDRHSMKPHLNHLSKLIQTKSGQKVTLCADTPPTYPGKKKKFSVSIIIAMIVIIFFGIKAKVRPAGRHQKRKLAIIQNRLRHSEDVSEIEDELRVEKAQTAKCLSLTP